MEETIEKKGVRVVLYKVVDGIARYVLFKRAEDWTGWELLKGGLKEDEDACNCAKREITEEAGIDIEVVKSSHGNVFHSKKGDVKVQHTMSTFFGDIGDNEIKICDEHSEYKLAAINEALELLPFDDLKDLLKKVDEEVRAHEGL